MRALKLLVVMSVIAVVLAGCGGSSTGTTSPAGPPNIPFDGLYGAQADQGETDDPLVDAATYASVWSSSRAPSKKKPT